MHLNVRFYLFDWPDALKGQHLSGPSSTDPYSKEDHQQRSGKHHLPCICRCIPNGQGKGHGPSETLQRERNGKVGMLQLPLNRLRYQSESWTHISGRVSMFFLHIRLNLLWKQLCTSHLLALLMVFQPSAEIPRGPEYLLTALPSLCDPAHPAYV